MNWKKITMTYLVAYLLVGGLGFALMPEAVLRLFLSNGDYGDFMPRAAGLFMTTLGVLLLRILRFEDWKYYSTTIYARSAIVVFLAWLYIKSNDPLWIVLNIVVLIGLIPSLIVHFTSKN